MLDQLGSIFGFIMTPLYWVISVILTGFHSFWSLIFDPGSGFAWALSIVGLTVLIRAALIPLFVKQIKSSRNMQLLQPKVKELQKKYSHDRERLAQETMSLYKETGTNPFASCLPLLLQMPIFIALFRLLNAAAHEEAKGVLTAHQAHQFGTSTLFGAHIADTFTGATSVNVQILAAVLVVAMTATTFLTQRQLMSKNMPASAMSGPYAQQQKMLLYVLPLVFAVGGIAFPVGVLMYWTTSNLWTMGQQFYVIRNNPAPGTPAAKAKEQRDAAKAARHGGGSATAAQQSIAELQDREGNRDGAVGDTGGGDRRSGDSAASDRRPAQRQQPKRTSRSQRKGHSPKQSPSGESSRAADADGNDSAAS